MLYFVEFSNPMNASCEAISMFWGMRCPLVAGVTARTAQAHDVQFTKNADTLSGKLMQYYASGTRFNTVTIKVYPQAKSAALMICECRDVLIDSIRLDSQAESVGMYCGSIKTSYFR